MTKAEWATLRRELQKLRTQIRGDTEKAISDMVGEEARLFFMDRITSRQTETH